MRVTTIFEDLFVKSNRTDKMDFAWKTVKEAAKSSSNPMVKDAYKRACQNTRTKQDIIKFVSFFHSVLFAYTIS